MTVLVSVGQLAPNKSSGKISNSYTWPTDYSQVVTVIFKQYLSFYAEIDTQQWSNMSNEEKRTGKKEEDQNATSFRFLATEVMHVAQNRDKPQQCSTAKAIISRVDNWTLGSTAVFHFVSSI